MYQMIEGAEPFPELKNIVPSKKNHQKILDIFRLPIHYSDKFSPEAKDLCQRLMKIEVEDRIKDFQEIKDDDMWAVESQ